RAKADRQLCADITKAHAANRAAYGMVRIWRYRNQAGVVCGKHRVRRLRRTLGLEVKRVKRFRAAR
ncbi:MAG: IS3 family transposase, partial [Gemmatimonadota bacterium]|nr:IS3 family transposase [Gemmatimonadota bacterium]